MASQQMLAVLLLAILAAASILPFAAATEIVVGDGFGWAPDFNYTNWAEGKEFRVGDKIIFRYLQGAHSVAIVGGEEFKACNASGARNILTSGNDDLLLQVTGRYWYICGVEDHCMRGQKLVIDVLPAAITPSPSSSPPPSSLPPPISPPSPSPSAPPPSIGPPSPSSPSPSSPPTPPPPTNNAPVSPPAPSPSSSSRRTTTEIYMMAMAAAAAMIFMHGMI